MVLVPLQDPELTYFWAESRFCECSRLGTLAQPFAATFHSCEKTSRQPEVEIDLGDDFPVNPQIKGALRSLGGVIEVQDA